jgi:hypothetical protein
MPLHAPQPTLIFGPRIDKAGWRAVSERAEHLVEASSSQADANHLRSRNPLTAKIRSIGKPKTMHVAVVVDALVCCAGAHAT